MTWPSSEMSFGIYTIFRGSGDAARRYVYKYIMCLISETVEDSAIRTAYCDFFELHEQSAYDRC